MIAAILLAAGRSTRMGTPKMKLPWKTGRSLITHMVEIFQTGGASPVVVVTGSDREVVEAALDGLDVVVAYNPDFDIGGMLSSIKVGLQIVKSLKVEAVLVSPGDFPLLRSETVKAMIDEWRGERSIVLVPRHAGRRGHPILVGKGGWDEVEALESEQTMRDFLGYREADISYIEVSDPGILRDVDTMEDYRRALEEGS